MMHEREDQQREVNVVDKFALVLQAEMCKGMTETQAAYFMGWLAGARDMVKTEGKKAS